MGPPNKLQRSLPKSKVIWTVTLLTETYVATTRLTRYGKNQRASSEAGRWLSHFISIKGHFSVFGRRQPGALYASGEEEGL